MEPSFPDSGIVGENHVSRGPMDVPSCVIMIHIAYVIVTQIKGSNEEK